MKRVESLLLQRSAVRNELESNMYRLKDLILKEEFIEISSESERNLISSNALKGSDLLGDDENVHKIEDYENMLKELVETEKNIKLRALEHKRRPMIVAKLEHLVIQVTEYIRKTRTDFPDPSLRAQTDDDLSTLEEKNLGTAKWLTDVMERQSKLEMTMEPIIHCSELESRHQELSRLYLSIHSKKLPPPPQPTTPTTPEKVPEQSPSPDGTDSAATSAPVEAESGSGAATDAGAEPKAEADAGAEPKAEAEKDAEKMEL
jgi:hypothetical protein